jgi:hypothetical protein
MFQGLAWYRIVEGGGRLSWTCANEQCAEGVLKIGTGRKIKVVPRRGLELPLES